MATFQRKHAEMKELGPVGGCSRVVLRGPATEKTRLKVLNQWNLRKVDQTIFEKNFVVLDYDCIFLIIYLNILLDLECWICYICFKHLIWPICWVNPKALWEVLTHVYAPRTSHDNAVNVND